MESVFNLSSAELEQTEVHRQQHENRNPEYKHFKSMKEEDAKFRVFAETLVNALDGQKFRARNGIEYDVLSNYIQTISSLRDQVRAPYTGIRGVIIFQEILRDKNPEQFQIWLDDGYIAKDLKFHTDRALFFSESNAQKRYAELTTK